MATKKQIESRHYLYWQHIASQTRDAALELGCLNAKNAAGWTAKDQLVLDDLRQAGRLLMEFAESLIDEIKEHNKDHDRS